MREVHIIEPWYNLNKIEQIIGRGTRSFGHKDLPENEKILRFIYMYQLHHQISKKILIKK